MHESKHSVILFSLLIEQPSYHNNCDATVRRTPPPRDSVPRMGVARNRVAI